MRRSTLARWAALFAIDPWDENRADLRAGEIAAAAANAAGATKRDGTQFAAPDFMFYRKAQVPPEVREAEQREAVSARFRAALLNAGGHKASDD